MSYSTSNPPQLVIGALGNTYQQVWAYRSTDADTVVDAAGYITNGGKLGMRVGDLVIVTDTDTGPTTTLHTVVSVNATTGVVDLSNAYSATNSD